MFILPVGECWPAFCRWPGPAARWYRTASKYAALLLLACEPVQVVSQRLGRASPVVTLTIYAHVAFCPVRLRSVRGHKPDRSFSSLGRNPSSKFPRRADEMAAFCVQHR
jgi:hypothetical protein